MLDDLKAKLKSVNEYLATKGIVFPFIRDNDHPSVSLTLLLTSFLLWGAGILEIVKDMDINAAENMVMITAGLYFGRKITKDKNKTELLDQSTKQGEDTSVAAK